MTFEEGMKQSIEETEREKCELLGIIQEKDKAIAELVEKKTALEKHIFELEKENAELKAQIEKMKCCSNCNHFNKENDIEYCQNCERQLVNSLDNFPREEIIKDEWEVRR